MSLAPVSQPPGLVRAARGAEVKRAALETDEPIDAVYTWVDGAAPGHAENLAQHSRSDHDRNPNRTRDNLELLRFSLRSLERFAPWIRRVVLVTQRPQIPAWLELSEPSLRIVHHDEIIDAEHLPTFNSFAILSNLHRIPGLSRLCLYFSDDYLLAGPVARSDFFWPDGAFKLYFARRRATGADLNGNPWIPRWNAALARCNALLDDAYGHAPRKDACHAPLLIERRSFESCASQWKAEFDRTCASRFRAPDNVAPRYLYPWFLACEGLGRAVSRGERARSVAYWGLDNWLPLQLAGLAWLRLRRAKFLCLNDNFGDKPNAAVESAALRYLERCHPTPSRFERVPAAGPLELARCELRPPHGLGGTESL